MDIIMKIRRAIGIIAKSRERYLLVYKVKNNDLKLAAKANWDFVKGGIEKGENWEEAVKRELKEEVGVCRYTILKKYDDAIEFKFSKNESYDKQKTIMCLVELFDEKITINNDEINRHIFVNKDELMNYIKYEETLKFIEKNLI